MNQDHDTIRRMHDYERLSGIFWIILGILQVSSILVLWLPGPIIGIWNIFAGTSRLKMASQIAARDANVPSAFEGMGHLIAIGVANLLIGGVIGIAFVALDFFIRDKILSNRHLFTGMQTQV